MKPQAPRGGGDLAGEQRRPADVDAYSPSGEDLQQSRLHNYVPDQLGAPRAHGLVSVCSSSVELAALAAAFSAPRTLPQAPDRRSLPGPRPGAIA